MYLSRLRRRVCVLTALVLGASSACAEDFTGVYAGVNAGYAFDRSQREGDGPGGTFPMASDQKATGLPPSALSASQSPAMRGTRPERPAR